MRRLALSTLALGLSLSACANKEDVVPADQDETADAAAASAGVPVNAEDFAREQLGARIQGPAGPEVEGSLATADGTALGDIESYVACPSNIDSCDPASLPDGTVYTFVHIVTPGVDKPNDDAMAQPETVKRVEKSVTFRMTMPADGSHHMISFPPQTGNILLSTSTQSLLEGVGQLSTGSIVEGFGTIRFTAADVVRHPIVGRIVEAYEGPSA